MLSIDGTHNPAAGTNLLSKHGGRITHASSIAVDQGRNESQKEFLA